MGLENNKDYEMLYFEDPILCQKKEKQQTNFLKIKYFLLRTTTMAMSVDSSFFYQVHRISIMDF